jgi:putative endonuclease
MKQKYYYVYITASISKVLYVGFTDCLVKRIYQHKKGLYENAFSKQYKTNRLVYWEHFYNKVDALRREQQIKRYRREKKIKLIEEHNIEWNDLYELVITISKVKKWI